MDAKELWIKGYGSCNIAVDAISAIKFAEQYHEVKLKEKSVTLEVQNGKHKGITKFK